MSIFSRQKYLSPQEESDLLRALVAAPFRDALMLSMLRSYGMRASELLGLARSDVCFESRSMIVRGLKGSLDRQLPLKDEHLAKLRAVCAGLAPSDRLFDITYNRLGDIWRRYRPGRKKLHSLRHSLAIEIYVRTKDLVLVKTILGHRSIQTTMIYQEFCYSQERLREVFR